MWVVLIAGCLLTIALFILFSETNHTVLLNRKVASLRTQLNRPELQNIMTYDKDAAAISSLSILKNGIIRPLKLLTRSPIVLFCSLYNWQPEMTGLAYLGIGVGSMIGITAVARTSDATIIRLAKKNNGVYEPEMRLPLCIFFGLLIPTSFFM
jgi:hypothetical protein